MGNSAAAAVPFLEMEAAVCGELICRGLTLLTYLTTQKLRAAMSGLWNPLLFALH